VICSNCLQGGALSVQGWLKHAQDKHNACEYPDCYCQHRVGEGIKKPPRD
jgi:hypothetical protein